MIKLHYFDATGRAESIRLLLHYAGVKFEDVRYKMEEWPKVKEKFELKQMPVLEIDGKQYCQSYAIMEFLGAKYGFLPKCHDELYRCMFVMNTAEDVFMKAFLGIHSLSPLDPKAKEETLKKLLEVEGPLALGAIEKKLKENCSKDFIVGCKYTIADFYLLGFYASVLNIPEYNKAFAERIKTKYPLLQAYADKRMIDFNPYYKKCLVKLHYFDMPGRAEMIRMMLKYKKVPFEDVRIKFADWPALKTSGKFELQQVPVMECAPCGITIGQSDAIMHRFGVKFGLLPLDKPEKLYKVVWFCNTIKDIMETCGKVGFAPMPEEAKKKMRETLFTQTAPVFFQAMENKFKANASSCYLVGKSYTIADFYLMGGYRSFLTNPMFPEFKELLAKYPLLLAYMEKQNLLL